MTPQCPHLSKMIRSTFSFQTVQIKLKYIVNRNTIVRKLGNGRKMNLG